MLRRIIPQNMAYRLKKFIRTSAEFPQNDDYQLTRGNISFQINRSDFVQWKIFNGSEDLVLSQAKIYAKTDTIVLDIGANVGGFSLRLANYCFGTGKQTQIHAFEPNLKVFGSLERNLALNPEAASLIRIYPIGMGKNTTTRQFEFTTSNTGAGRVVPQTPGNTQVQIQQLDDFVQKLSSLPISFVKLIIEGSEPEALRGGWNTIKKYKPPIFLEVTRTWWGEHGYSVEDVLADLQTLGYQFKIEQNNELINYIAEKHADIFQYNLLAYQ